MKNPASILVTGGSSGLGEGLCMHYAEPGKHIFFNGRSQQRVEKVAAALREKGAAVEGRILDVSNREAMDAWIREADKIAPLDLVIANAGIGTPRGEGITLADQACAVFDTNVYGVFNTIHPALELMLGRGRGQIVIISSMTAFMGMGIAPAYSSSKAAVKSYGRALRTKYMNKGIEVTTICPGVVPTAMTAAFSNRFPGYVPYDKAIIIMVRGIESGKGLIVFPLRWLIPTRLISNLPDSWIDALRGRLMRPLK